MKISIKVELYLAYATCLVWLFADFLSVFVYFKTQNPVFITWALLCLVLFNIELLLIKGYKKEDNNGDKKQKQ
jgi:hypothetical protein